MIGNVHESTLSLSGSIKFEGPGGEQRTAEYRHVPTVEHVTGIIFWASSFYYYLLVSRMSLCRAITPVHIILLTMFSRGLVALLEWEYNMHVITDSKAKRYDRALTQLIAIVRDVSELMMLRLIAYGWKVLRENLSPAEIRVALALPRLRCYEIRGLLQSNDEASTACDVPVMVGAQVPWCFEAFDESHGALEGISRTAASTGQIVVPNSQKYD